MDPTNQNITIAPLQKKKGLSKRTIFIIVSLLTLIIGIGVGLYVITQQRATVERRAAGGPSCPAEGATCSWDAVSGATSYTFTIRNKTTGTVVKSGTTSQRSVTFTPVVGQIYECSVKAVNACGVGPEAKAQNSCVAILTPTPTTVPSPTPTLTPTPTEILTPSPTLPPGVTPTNTPTPTPTSTPAPGATNTPTPTETVLAQEQPTSTPTEIAPTIPSAGSSSSVYFMVLSVVLLAALLFVF